MTAKSEKMTYNLAWYSDW